MTKKEELKHNVMLSMQYHLDPVTLEILGNVLIRELHSLDVVELETLPATIDDTNQYILELFRMQKAPKLSRQTTQYYLDTITRLIGTVQKPLNCITTMDIEYYLRSIQHDNGPTSLNNQRRNLSAFFTWMRKMHLIGENPAEMVESFRETEKPIDHMEPEEWEQLKTGCCHPRDRALLEFLRCTAVRRGEIEDICICDVDWRTGRISVNGHKTSTYRPVCLDSVAIKYLQDYLQWRGVSYNSREPLFACNNDNAVKALSSAGVYGAVKKIASRAGMERNIYPHLFRKTTATNIIKRGGSEEAAGEYLGHKPQSVTGRHYSFKSEEHAIKIFQDYVAAV